MEYEQICLDQWIADMQEDAEDGLLIAPFIPFGRRNAVSRTELAIKMGVSDRAVRRMIEEDRLKVVILNAQDGKGYYRPTTADAAEFLHCIRQNESRAISIWRWLEVMKQEYKDLF